MTVSSHARQPIALAVALRVALLHPRPCSTPRTRSMAQAQRPGHHASPTLLSPRGDRQASWPAAGRRPSGACSSSTSSRRGSLRRGRGREARRRAGLRQASRLLAPAGAARRLLREDRQGHDQRRGRARHLRRQGEGATAARRRCRPATSSSTPRRRPRSSPTRSPRAPISRPSPRRTPRTPAPRTTAAMLGYFGHGQMVRSVRAGAFALKAGELSKPVKSQFGWHLIKVEDRREEAAADLRGGQGPHSRPRWCSPRRRTSPAICAARRRSSTSTRT